MKNVFCPKKGEIIQIDEKKESNWKSKYNHISGKPFEGAKKVTPKKKKVISKK